MSSSNQIVAISPILRTFRSLKDIALFRGVSISKSQKVILISVTASIALLGVLARYLRRRKLPSNVQHRKFARSPQLLPNPNGEYFIIPFPNVSDGVPWVDVDKIRLDNIQSEHHSMCSTSAQETPSAAFGNRVTKYFGNVYAEHA